MPNRPAFLESNNGKPAVLALRYGLIWNVRLATGDIIGHWCPARASGPADVLPVTLLQDTPGWGRIFFSSESGFVLRHKTLDSDNNLEDLG